MDISFCVSQERSNAKTHQKHGISIKRPRDDTRVQCAGECAGAQRAHLAHFMVPLGPLGVLPTFYPSAIASLGVSCRRPSLGVSIPRRRQSSASAVGTFGAPHDANRLQHNAPRCQQSQHLAPTVPATFGISYPSASGFLGVGIVRISRRRHCSASAVGTFGAPHDADQLQHNAPQCQPQRQHQAPTVPATFGISYPSASGFLGVGIVRISRRRHCLASAVGTFGAPHDADRLQHNVPWYQSRRLAPTAPATFGISYPLASGFLGVGIVSNPRHLTQSRPVNKMTHYSLKERD
ncbi:hypothetical protein B0H34DRAFT_810373 [Crassisporium funariophilum]|nr:hypothetical protein B0H34DRAFT_821656 [Crassisporium funariophilum]KAF8152503.1 hypothetical protein B0H34DRAFT_810373 [Crassisporium funariophilum]